MRRRERALAARLTSQLQKHSQRVRPLPGIADGQARVSFVEQLVESIRRVRYVDVLRTRQLSNRRLDPAGSAFDPIKAAILAARAGALDEAYWFVFLSVHFGKHRRSGWSYARSVYGQLGERDTPRWDWTRTSSDPRAFRNWLDKHQRDLKAMPGGFGNHRKYESLDARSPNGTGAVVESYVRWVSPPRTHPELMQRALDQVYGDPTRAFNLLYKSMADVRRFGRTARFDYLCMVSKLALAPIRPGFPYMRGATGPATGARLLFRGGGTTREPVGDLDRWLVDLDEDLKVGMQVLEDALCNWQKSPRRFRPFRG